MDNKYPGFFKVYVPELHSEKMPIPNAFVKMARQQGWEPRNVILKSSRGKVWEVKTLAIYSQLYFGDGWKQFREDNCLGAMDFVFFTHVEDNVFNFKICELSTGCEKMKVEDSEEQEKEKGDVDDVMELDKEEDVKQQDGDGDEHDPGQDDSGDEVEEKEEDQQQEDEDGDEHDPSEDDDSEEEEEEEEEEQQDEDDDDYDPGEKHGKGKYDVIELDDEEEEEEQDEDGDEDDSSEDDSSDEEEQEEQEQQDEDDDDYDPGEDDSDDDEEVEEEENTELEEGDEEESKLTKKRKSHPKVCKVSSKREIGSSSVTKAEDAGHENIDAAMYIRRDHPYFIVKLLKGRRNELHIPHLIIKDFSLRFKNKITLVCCQCQNIPRTQLRNYHGTLPQLTPANKKHTEEGELSVWRDGRVCIKGWLHFCRKNKIKENDSCICEIVLREDQPIEMFRVHVANKK